MAAAVVDDAGLWMVTPLLVTLPATALVASAKGATWLAHPALVFFGVASYSIYLWHVPVHSMISPDSWSMTSVGIGAFVGVVAYVLLERPWMCWRSRRLAEVLAREVDSSQAVVDSRVGD